MIPRSIRTLSLLTLAAALFASLPAAAATFVVPPDRAMVHRADVVVIGTALESYTQLTPDGAVETVTPIAVEEVLRGVHLSETLLVTEPGGSLAGVSMLIPGAPQFTAGERSLLFLKRVGNGRFAVADLALGKFSFRSDESGDRLLVRDAAEIHGWDDKLRPYQEPVRSADRFVAFVRAEVKGQPAEEDYFLVPTPGRQAIANSTSHAPATDVAPYTANSYTMTISGSMGARWSVFPAAVTFYQVGTEPGAPGGGTTAITAAFSAWDNDCGSDVNYVYGGVDGTHTQGLHGADGANTVLFERDLSSWGVSPFTCSANSYSGTLGLGGVTSASGTNSVNGETFVTTREGDVEMNRGLANCTLLLNNGDFNSAVTHEVGHTLGFRHSDQNRASSGSCSSDPSLECSSSAIMRSFVVSGVNARLQAWDQHAVQAVYPGNVCAPGGQPSCTPPSITAQPASVSVNKGSSATLTVIATGTSPLTYQWYIGTSGSTANPISGATGSSLTVTPAATGSYWVRVSNSCGSANSTTSTVTVAAPTCVPVSITAQPASISVQAGHSATIAVGTSGTAPISYQWYVGTSGNTASPVAGANSSSLTVAPSTTTTYWVRATNACGSANSSTATVTVTSASCTPPSITAQPASTTLQPGTSATLAVGVAGTGPFTYQWYTGPSGTTSNPIAGGNNASITVAPSSTTSYWVRVSNSCGSANSSTATVTVGSSGGACTPPVITRQPGSGTFAINYPTPITVTATGTAPLSYQWYIGNSGDTSHPIAGATSATYSVNISTPTNFWVRVSNACGTVNSTTSVINVSSSIFRRRTTGN